MAILDREIHELPAAESVDEAALLPIEQEGEAQKLSFRLLRQYINRNVIAVETVARQGETGFSTEFDEETGILTLIVPAQAVDSYSKAEIDAKLSALTIPIERVVVSADQRLSGVLMYDIDQQRYVRLLACGRTTYDGMRLAGNDEQDAMYFPYEERAPLVPESGT